MDEMNTIESLANAIKEIIEYQKHLANEITEIKTAIMDDLINPIKDEYEKMEYDNALSDWRCKYAEKLEGFDGKLKALEGEDFDIIKKSFDDFNERTDGMEPDEYVEKLAESITEQLNTIGEAFGVEPEKIEEVKIETEDGIVGYMNLGYFAVSASERLKVTITGSAVNVRAGAGTNYEVIGAVYKGQMFPVFTIS